jgi:shikimate kinase
VSQSEPGFNEYRGKVGPHQLTRIFLTGFMGAGKSTIGKLLADALQRRFYDTDRLVMKGFGTNSVTDIFKVHGEAAFREAEEQVVQSLCKREQFVASVGGGTLVRPETLEPALSCGIVVYLYAPVDILFERVIFSGKDRPLLSEPDTEQRFYERFNNRSACYERSHLVVSTHDKNREAIVSQIVNRLNDIQNNA